ncbi:putative membrane protein [Catalinimonas alkaloidigena]|uniref:DUF819 family protein n=1 Tax=Catalinimonas alkaloidigena TaxID=1075417 RepID=UPI0024051192|nr:DUF819 family protein [Catalinimonas alkaloidigena]MDF9795522.1 putative membrane protein [Catalinimonas alkaloidigena]
MEQVVEETPFFTNDAVVLGILFIILALVFRTSASRNPFWQKFYTYVPSVLLCYFIPAILNSLNIISGEDSSLYFVSSRYLLPASLILFTLGIDLKAISRLGFKAVIMFFAGTLGIIIGGPLAMIIVSTFSPETLGGAGPDAVWRGLATIAGSWIGGGANQTAMLEVFGASTDLFSAVLAVDIIVANLWLAVLLYGSGRADKIDNYFKADASAIHYVKKQIEEYAASIAKIPTTADTMTILAIAFGITGFSHFASDLIAPFLEANYPALNKFSLTSGFFWIVVIATTAGLILSFTKARKLEGAGSSRFATIFLYVLIASIGMQMDITTVVSNPGLFMVGGIWILVHISFLLIVAKLIKAPFFFVAVGSQANVGGAASAPVVASAFSPSLAPVGVLLAVLGYFVGTYGAWLCGILMQLVAGS